jgi:polysaccharide pyruvyl transferase WcaK-like protein
MASLQDVEQLADDLENLVGELRSQLRNDPDFEKLMQIADEISEHADGAAQTFSSINETLLTRIKELSSGSSKKPSQKSGGAQSREKSQPAAS